MKKCICKELQLLVFGHVIGRNGVLTNVKKTEIISRMQEPTNVIQIRSFLGMTNYFSKIVPRYAALVSRLLQLTEKYM